MSGTLRLSRFATDCTLSPSEIGELQRQFRERHHVRLAGLLSADLLSAVMPHLAGGEFKETEYEDVGADMRLAGNAALDALHLAFNDAVFLNAIETIVETAPLRVFWGRIYRMLPGPKHASDWHDDLFGDRQIGMSVNLSSTAFSGGDFQMRRVGESTLLGEVHNATLGDAILFRLSPSLEHRVMAVTGEQAKTAFAGWFRPGNA